MAQTPTTASGVGRPQGSTDTRRVLHVDDDRLQTELVSRQLGRIDEELDVESVTSVDAAIERLEAGDVDCLVTDFDMGEADATDLLKSAAVTERDLPVVLFTSRDAVALESTGVLDAVDEYLRKGGDTERYGVLADLVRTAMDRSTPDRPVPLASAD